MPLIGRSEAGILVGRCNDMSNTVSRVSSLTLKIADDLAEEPSVDPDFVDELADRQRNTDDSN